MSEGPFLNIKAPKVLLERLDDYRAGTAGRPRLCACPGPSPAAD
jgi:hypothetical protein